MVPVLGVDHAPTTAFAAEAPTLSPGPPISVPVPKQLGSPSGQGLETPPTVSDHAVLTIVVANLAHVTGSRIRSDRYRSAQMRMSCPSSTLHHSFILNYHNSQCYCITSECDRQFRSLISIFSILLDIVLECILEDTDHPGPTTMNVQIFSPERRTGEALTLTKISRLVWKHHGSIKL